MKSPARGRANPAGAGRRRHIEGYPQPDRLPAFRHDTGRAISASGLTEGCYRNTDNQNTRLEHHPPSRGYPPSCAVPIPSCQSTIRVVQTRHNEMRKSLLALSLVLAAGHAVAATAIPLHVSITMNGGTGKDNTLTEQNLRQAVVRGFTMLGIEPKTVSGKGDYASVTISYGYVEQLKDLRMAALAVEYRTDDGTNDIARCGSTSLVWTSPRTDRFLQSLSESVANGARKCKLHAVR